ncbi:SpoIIE family protein phosphatase [Actinospica sp. MGRD01-02]|uniref:protein-serine/threonine phosphatase n=1 Tax=Actinospica acidithermotolerans TaxID=2828514 RepID=A0A941IJX1_9ACTN|nr:SpoIIE family protein phosphatase/ATP-binding protein [Actinospica acidithermotolerans]MBR7828327.1 SpoIIE family protein phosphatase [Actinospica acidithermotolerans]
MPRQARQQGLRPRRGRGRRISQQILLVQLVILALTSLIGFALFAFTQRGQLDSYFEQRAVAIAQVAAGDPLIRSAMAAGTAPSPHGIVQIEAQRIAYDSGASYIVVIDLNRIRHSHPIPSLVGQPVSEPIVVRDGQPHVRVDSGATGRSANGRVPLYAPGPGRQLVGEVSAGIAEAQASSQFSHELSAFGLYVGIALGIGAAASYVLARRLKRTTFGLEFDDVAGLLQDREATLHGIHEGVVGCDARGRVTVINGEARRLLGLPEGELEGRRLTEIGLNPAVASVLGPGQSAKDEVLTVGDLLLVVNSWPTGRDGGPPGSVATLRDSTELRLLSQKAETVRKRLKLLYDASGAVGSTLDVERTADELTRVAVPHFADFIVVDLVAGVVEGDEPRSADRVRLHRVAMYGIHDVYPFTPLGEVFEPKPGSPPARAIECGRAVLETNLETAVEWRSQDPERAQAALDLGLRSSITAPLRARGVLLGIAYFWRSLDRPAFEQDDVSLAEELVARAALSIDNARRYTREHETAVTLQRSLLPRRMPEVSAVELAFRYLPAQSVGGDWFDVIPLPGARVALAVGDVVGHGLHAAATMGRLRTAVRNFSALDLPPDELLWHLDELVGRIDQEESGDVGPTSILGASCLYAIYDPTTRSCAMARAAHPPPALMLPDGTVSFPDVPAGPPLGLAMFPFETVEIELPEGSQLVLYTDGLIEQRGRDLDESLDLLRAALGNGSKTPEQTCVAVLNAMPPSRADDVALLVARTYALPEDRIIEWEVPADPAAVSAVRSHISRQLLLWGLGDMEFTTELILSELATNAIRYATGPIRVRVLYDRTLICEVSDTSSTSPHLRYATLTDEGGRGLFLVAQLAERWGTRYLPAGKIIWAEQALPEPSDHVQPAPPTRPGDS